MAEQAIDAVQRAGQLQDLKFDWHRRLGQTRASANLLRLSDRLFETPVLTIPDAAKALDVTYATGQRLVERLVQEGILTALDDRSYGKTFVAHPILAVLRADVSREL